MVSAGHVEYLQSTLSDSSRGVAYWQSTAFDYRYTGLVFLPVVPNLCQLKRCPAFSQICHLPIQLSVLIDCGFAVLFVDI